MYHSKYFAACSVFLIHKIILNRSGYEEIFNKVERFYYINLTVKFNRSINYALSCYVKKY